MCMHDQVHTGASNYHRYLTIDTRNISYIINFFVYIYRHIILYTAIHLATTCFILI